MRVGLISDVHANRVALEAVLADMPTVDALACAGDVVGYNPWPAECVEMLREREVPTVMGNHDRMVVERGSFRFNSMAQAGVKRAQKDLEAEGRRWLESLPETRHAANARHKLNEWEAAGAAPKA